MNREAMSQKVRKLVGLALFTAIIVVLQFVASTVRLGPFSITLVLAPIVVGAAMYGIAAGAYLGLVFGTVVLLSGDAAAFLAVSPIGTIITVIVKGLCAGLAAAAVYKLFEKKNKHLAVFTSAVICPIVNTGVFLIGCLIFFMGIISEWAAGMGYESAGKYLIFGMVGLNFFVEMAINILLSNVIFRIIKVGKKELGR